MDIVFSANNREEVIHFPIVPSQISWNTPQENETFDTINLGEVNLIGLTGLRTFSIQSFFPVHTYNFSKTTTDGWDYVEFFNKWREERVPIRVIITTKDGKEVLNMPCTIKNFRYGLDRTEDISYTLDIKEFRFIEVT